MCFDLACKKLNHVCVFSITCLLRCNSDWGISRSQHNCFQIVASHFWCRSRISILFSVAGHLSINSLTHLRTRPWLNIKMLSYHYIVDIRLSLDRHISTIGFSILIKWQFILNQTPEVHTEKRTKIDLTERWTYLMLQVPARLEFCQHWTYGCTSPPGGWPSTGIVLTAFKTYVFHVCVVIIDFEYIYVDRITSFIYFLLTKASSFHNQVTYSVRWDTVWEVLTMVNPTKKSRKAYKVRWDTEDGSTMVTRTSKNIEGIYKKTYTPGIYDILLPTKEFLANLYHVTATRRHAMIIHINPFLAIKLAPMAQWKRKTSAI